MRRINLGDMIHEASVELLKRTCHHCERDYYDHMSVEVEGYIYPMCPTGYGNTFVSQLLMLGDAFLVDDLEFDCLDKDRYS